LYKYSTLKKIYLKYEIVDKNKILAAINDFLEKLLFFKNEIRKLITNIKGKYEEFINLMNDICQVKLTLEQFLSANIDGFTQESSFSKRAVIYRDKVDELEKKLKGGYEKNKVQIRKEIDEIKEQIPTVVNAYIFNSILKTYLRRLIFFTNKFRDEDKNIDNALYNAEKMYMQKKYIDGIELLIRIL
jgi:hypothetical protein